MISQKFRTGLFSPHTQSSRLFRQQPPQLAALDAQFVLMIVAAAATGSCLAVFLQTFLRPVVGSYNRALELWGAGSREARRKTKGALFTGRCVLVLEGTYLLPMRRSSRP